MNLHFRPFHDWKMMFFYLTRDELGNVICHITAPDNKDLYVIQVTPLGKILNNSGEEVSSYCGKNLVELVESIMAFTTAKKVAKQILERKAQTVRLMFKHYEVDATVMTLGDVIYVDKDNCVYLLKDDAVQEVLNAVASPLRNFLDN